MSLSKSSLSSDPNCVPWVHSSKHKIALVAAPFLPYASDFIVLPIKMNYCWR